MKIKKRQIALLITVLVMGLAFTGCSCTKKSDVTTNVANQTNQTADATVSKEYTLKVTNKEGAEKKYQGKTESQYLVNVLDELVKAGDFTYETDGNAASPMLVKINGETAEYSADKAYWAIYVNNTYASHGIQDQPINNGDTIELKYEAAK
ncbi:MAG: DUF4430 domain-containing protein [Lachnospiraceae bacterium]|nr:DUF4430 domain-containing protein [Lachnospiraceae bacterium]